MRTLTHEMPGWARPYIGIDFAERGRNRRDGVDCWGLVRLVYAERLGITLSSHHDGYAGVGVDDRESIRSLFVQELARPGVWQRIMADEIRPYDLALFRLGREMGHVGVVCSSTRMLHALEGIQSCHEEFSGPMWNPRLVGFRRYVGPITLQAKPKLFSDDIVRAEIPVGVTIAEALAFAQIHPSPLLHVFVGDVEVPAARWAHVKPKPGRQITVTATPLGGGGEGGKSGVRILATLAIVAGAIVAPYAIGGAAWVAAHGLGASLITAGVGLVGTLAVNALFPPSQPRFDASASSSPTLSGTGNEVRRYGVVPRPLGRHRWAPPYAAVPFTEVIGNDTYLRCLFAWYGPTAISELKLGDTPLEELEGVEVEIREGRPGDDPVTLYPNTVQEQGLSITLTNNDGWTLRTSGNDADELMVDITLPAGLAQLNGDGSRSARTVAVEIEYSPAGAGTWTAVNGTSPDYARGLDFLFRTPEVVPGGNGDHVGEIAWGAGFGTKPAYLPASEYSWEASGYVYAPATGSYAFGLDCSDAGEIQVDNRVVASWYGTHATSSGGATPDYAAHQGTITLTRGYHLIRVRMEARSTAGAVALGWKKPGDGAFSTIPGANLYKQARNTVAGAGALSYRWFDATSYSATISITASDTSTIKRSIAWPVQRGQYDVRVRRVTPDSTGSSIVDVVAWTALRTIKAQDPIRLPNLAKVAIRIKATDQLSGVLENFNLVTHSICPDYDADTGAWVERATSNCAAIYRHLFQGTGNKRRDLFPDSKMDLAELALWHDQCRLGGFEFNAIVDTAGTLLERARDVAAAGRANYGRKNDIVSVVRERVQTVPVQLLTPRNTTSFSAKKVFSDLPHALRVQFFDEDRGFERGERIVLDDGYQIDGLDAFDEDAPTLPPATKFEVLELFGCTSAAQAFKLARYHMAVARLRPEVYTVGTDAEHLACVRGSLVMITHDVPFFGLGSARIVRLVLDTADNLVGLVLDDNVTMDAGDSYRIRVRLSNGAHFVAPIVTEEGVHREITLGSPVSPTDPRPEVGNLLAFGRVEHETHECLVKDIEYGEDHSATLRLIDSAPAVLEAADGPIPPYDPDISQPPVFENRPETPIIEQIRSDELVMIRDADGSLRNRMLITLRQQSGTRPIPNAAQVRLRIRPDPILEPQGPWSTLPLIPLDHNTVSVENVEQGLTYQIRLRTVTSIGQASNTVEAEHTVVGKSSRPPDVMSFAVARLSDGTRRYSWVIAPPGQVPPDLAGVLLRYGQPGSTWELMTPLNADPIQSSPSELNEPPAGTWRFAVKAVDTSGNESLNPTYAEASLDSPRLENVAFSHDEAVGGWVGTKTDCFINGARELEAVDNATWDTLATLGITSWDTWQRWNSQPRSPITYESTVLDAGFVFWWSPDAIAIVDGREFIRARWSTDGVTFTEYADLASVRGTSVQARYLQIELRVEQTPEFPVPVIRSLVTLMRSPGVTSELQDVATASLDPRWRLGVGDLRLPVAAGRFNLIRSVSISFNGMGPGWSWEMVDRDPVIGPRVKLYNADAELADAVIDVVIRGL